MSAGSRRECARVSPHGGNRERCGEGRISGVPKASGQRRQRLADLRRQQPPLGDPVASRTTSTAAVGRSRGVPHDVNSRHIPRDHHIHHPRERRSCEPTTSPQAPTMTRGPMTTSAGRTRRAFDRRSASPCRRCPRVAPRMRTGFARWFDRWRCGEGRMDGVPKASGQRRQRLADLRRQQPPLGDPVAFPRDVNSRHWAIPWRFRATSTAAISRATTTSTTRANGGRANPRHPRGHLR
jgi:hypothetical protein